MKSTWFSCRKRYDFARCISEVDYSRHSWDLFRSFLVMAHYSMRQAVHKMTHGELDDEIEQKVLAEQARYPKWQKFGEALGILTLALEDQSYDFLGTYMGEMDMNDSKWRGQCFTPKDLCAIMAQMTFGDISPTDGRTLMLSEPACGGGAMIIAASNILKDNGFYPWHYYWQAVDVDWRCYAITYIQLTLLGIPASVINGNTLTLETFESAATIAGVLHPPKQREPADVTPDTDEADQVPMVDSSVPVCADPTYFVAADSPGIAASNQLFLF